jgi:hypothetical protein
MMQYLWMFLAGVIAFNAGRGVFRWTIAAYFFGWMVFIPLLLMPMKKEKHLARMAFINNKSEEYIVGKEFKSVETVDDLFKQLETPKG